MIAFQYLAIAFLIGLILRELYALRSAAFDRRFVLLRVGICVIAVAAVAAPELTHAVAGSVGITRGADLVLYIFALGALGVCFYFYSRYVRLQRQLTEVVRHLALREAREPRN